MKESRDTRINFSRYAWINKTGNNIPIYDYYDKKIGTLYKDEVCIYDPSWGGDGIKNLITFLNSKKQLSEGFIYKDLTGLAKVGVKEKVVVNGKDEGTFSIFKIKKNTDVLMPNGAWDYNLPANQYYIAVSDDSIAGSSTNTILVRYIKKTGCKWQKCTSWKGDVGTPGTGFAKIGLENASGFNNINFTNKW
ncbi:MAG: hypothetical protein LBR30_06960 [Clostridioides sp.]|jgi:hypothetical protein|nr:hypothetical protein [Clostridioides sp.]